MSNRPDVLHSEYDFLVVLLHEAAGGGPLSQNPERLHTVFYRLKQKYSDTIPELKEFRFVTAGAFPYSPDLTDALDILQLSGAISRENPSYERFTPKSPEGIADWLEENRRRIAGDDPDKEEGLAAAIGELGEALRLE